MKKLIWLDDKRNPEESNWIEVYSPITRPFEVIWLKSYDEFIAWINLNGMPDAICFDHDLGLPNHIKRVEAGMSKRESRKLKAIEKTGYDCAKWLVEYCMDNKAEVPPYNIQSSNLPGKENINGLLKSFIKFRKRNP